ncbi:MAG: TadE family protein [Polyangiaceae bacterium]
MKRLHKDVRGAAIVEFIAVLPLVLMIFFVMVQYGHLLAARLILQHGAASAARMAIVGKSAMSPGKFVGDTSDPLRAALGSMGSWTNIGSPAIDAVDVTTHYSKDDAYGPVTVTLTGTYHCKVPVARRMFCGETGRTMHVTAILPNQGARYAEES